MSTKKLVAIIKPPKPIAQMSDAEIDTFAGRLYDHTAQATGQAPPKK